MEARNPPNKEPKTMSAMMVEFRGRGLFFFMESTCFRPKSDDPLPPLGAVGYLRRRVYQRENGRPMRRRRRQQRRGPEGFCFSSLAPSRRAPVLDGDVTR